MLQVSEILMVFEPGLPSEKLNKQNNTKTFPAAKATELVRTPKVKVTTADKNIQDFKYSCLK